jgi:uroporphyrinogen-III decarboxylase
VKNRFQNVPFKCNVRRYLTRIVSEVKKTHPDLPLIMYASGSGGLLERLQTTGVGGCTAVECS